MTVTTKRDFVEPEIVKYAEPLDRVTLHYNCYSTSSGSAKGSS